MKKLNILAVVFILPFIVLGWGKTGHRAIAQMGQDLLSAEVQNKITSLLGGSNMAMVANLADDVRSDAKYGYVSSWHYTNLEKGLSREQFDKIALTQDKGQMLFRVYSLAQTLHNRKHNVQHPDLLAEVSDTMLLKFLIHFTGDMHQPMHLGRPEDRGGNQVDVNWFDDQTSLHSLWDNKIITFETLSYTEWAQYLSSTNKLNPVKISSEEELKRAVVDWAWEVYKLTNIVYESAADISGKTNARTTFTYVYNYKWVYEQSFCRAAEHLAGIMNYIYE
jgi:hypothetical protein